MARLGRLRRGPFIDLMADGHRTNSIVPKSEFKLGDSSSVKIFYVF